MKRLALFLAVLAVLAGSTAFAGATVQAYQPVDEEELFADPDEVLPGGTFEAVLVGCFPGEAGEGGEQVLFVNLGTIPNQSAVTTCDSSTYEARVTFEAPVEVGEHRIVAILVAGDSVNPDIPDRPARFLEAFYVVSDENVDVGLGSGGAPDGGAAVIATGGSSDNWPSFLSTAGFYRTFLGLLGLMAGIFLVWLWRRRKEDERLEAAYRPGMMVPPGPSKPWMA